MSPEEVAAFKAFGAPVLDDMAKDKPTFEEWKERPVVKATYGRGRAGPLDHERPVGEHRVRGPDLLPARGRDGVQDLRARGAGIAGSTPVPT